VGKKRLIAERTPVHDSRDARKVLLANSGISTQQDSTARREQRSGGEAPLCTKFVRANDARLFLMNVGSNFALYFVSDDAFW
jgi:hypothetical protein